MSAYSGGYGFKMLGPYHKVTITEDAVIVTRDAERAEIDKYAKEMESSAFGHDYPRFEDEAPVAIYVFTCTIVTAAVVLVYKFFIS